MADVLTPEQRRRNMQAVRGANTRQELRLRKALCESGMVGYRKNSGKVTGRPDVAYTRWRVAVFVDGCFWHGCPECYRAPASNAEFWSKKLERNQARDLEVTSQLEDCGWTVVRFWEHEAKSNLDECVSRVRDALRTAGRIDGSV